MRPRGAIYGEVGGANTYGYLLPRFSALKRIKDCWLIGSVLLPRGFTGAFIASEPRRSRQTTAPALSNALPALLHKPTDILTMHESLRTSRKYNPDRQEVQEIARNFYIYLSGYVVGKAKPLNGVVPSLMGCGARSRRGGRTGDR